MSIRAAALDAVEQRVRNDVAPDLLADIRERLEAYGDRHDYDVRAIVEAARADIRRQGDQIRIQIRLPDPSLLFEHGTVDHVVEARNADVLSFVWEERHDPPEWVREEFDREGDGYRVFLPSVEVTGLPEGRFVRDSLRALERRLR